MFSIAKNKKMWDNIEVTGSVLFICFVDWLVNDLVGEFYFRS